MLLAQIGGATALKWVTHSSWGHSTRAYTKALDRPCHPLHCHVGGATAPMGLPRHPGTIAPGPIPNYWIEFATHCTAILVVPQPSGVAQAPNGHSTRPYAKLLDRLGHPLHCHAGGATALRGLHRHPGAIAPGPIQKYWIDFATHCTYSLVVPLPSRACTGTQGP